MDYKGEEYIQIFSKIQMKISLRLTNSPFIHPFHVTNILDFYTQIQPQKYLKNKLQIFTLIPLTPWGPKCVSEPHMNACILTDVQMQTTSYIHSYLRTITHIPQTLCRLDQSTYKLWAGICIPSYIWSFPFSLVLSFKHPAFLTIVEAHSL